MYVDLAAEELVAAEKEGRKIAVEIKSFIGASEIEDLIKCHWSVCTLSQCVEEHRARTCIVSGDPQATYKDRLRNRSGSC